MQGTSDAVASRNAMLVSEVIVLLRIIVFDCVTLMRRTVLLARLLPTRACRSVQLAQLESILLQVQQRAQAAQAPAAGELPSAEPGPSPAQQAAIEAGERAGADAAAPVPEVKRAPPAVVGRNEPCPCGSGKKFKSCHGARTPEVKA